MLKRIALTVFVTLIYITSQAQTLYMPRDITKAYQKNTRDVSGKPGKNYWQNHGRYNIHVTVAPPNLTVTGTEEIIYTNNSPDTLKGLNMKLIINIHRPGAARWSPANKRYLTEGMRIDTFKVNDEPKQWNNETRGATNELIRLTKPLLPHDSLRLNITWHYDVSLQSEREGMIDSTTYYLAYFYPRVAVYDDYNGWDRLPFTDGLEFYNDFNDYHLGVTVPKNFLVWSTGTLQNAAQVLQPDYAKRLQASFKSDSTIHVATLQDLETKKVTLQKDMNTWVWTANNITDMALGISDHYIWDAASTIVDKFTGKRASMQAAYLNTSEDFKHSVQWGLYSLKFFSETLPGVPYPFPKMTAFQGFADMEYPMMVNDSHNEDLKDARLTQDHEIAHTYFPFYMGINETRYGYMDEGWATTLEYQAGEAENGKPSLSYLALQDMLGNDLFKKALHTYMDNWHGKHPIPWDYFNSMSTGSGQNLDWFFRNWFFTNNYLDIAINKVTPTANGLHVDVKNIGGFAIPFDVVLTYADGTTKTYHQKPSVWQHNEGGFVINLTSNQPITAIKLDNGIFVDANESDNSWKK